MGKIIKAFPLLTIVSATIIIITGIFCQSKDAITAGATIAGIAGTAYQSSSEDDSDAHSQLDD